MHLNYAMSELPPPTEDEVRHLHDPYDCPCRELGQRCRACEQFFLDERADRAGQDRHDTARGIWLCGVLLVLTILALCL